MTDVISYSKVIEHERLSERLTALRSTVGSARAEAPDLPTGPVLAGSATRLLRDIYRLVSREPGARALTRLDPRQPVTHRQLAVILRDGQVALDAFAWSHYDHAKEYGDEWLTIEGIEDFRLSRRNLSPRAEDES